MLPTEIVKANTWRKLEKLALIKCQSLRKRSTRSKLERDRKCHTGKKARQENSNTIKTSSPCASSTPLPKINPYNTKQSYGKAVAPSRKALPICPRKKLAVVAGLASHVGLNLETKMDHNLKNLRGLSEETKSAARDFFFRLDISYTMPGLNDVITVWDDSGKKKLREYCLTMFLREAHEMYCQT